MARTVALPDPAEFGLSSFAEILPARDPIVGEDPGSFDGFHEALMASLAPATPYECVIAENLVAIEWELLQHRRMRDAGLRQIIRNAIGEAVLAQRGEAHNDALDQAWERHEEAGGTEEDWEEPFQFDREAAEAAGADLAMRAISRDRAVQASAYEEIRSLGMDPVELMGEAYRSRNTSVVSHDLKVTELERRRREVRRDYGALQNARPLDSVVIEA